MKIIIGLGNPGPEYGKTRHNVGYRVADALGALYSIRILSRRAKSLVGEGAVEGFETAIAKPETFMNNSGRATAALLEKYNSGLDDLLVVCDDFHLELGRLRVRRTGSSGGQKGLQSIIDTLGSQDFARLRIGIGEVRRDPVDFVLSRFSKAEEEVIGQAVDQAARACAVWARDGIEACMNEFNRSPAD
jgi:peptidyl-tRNA hydrolase, PTH1 family